MKKNWFLIYLNNKYFLKGRNRIFNCQIGEGGRQKAAKKLEGDKTTPIGKWYLKSVYFRSDKVLRPKTKKKYGLKITKITKNCGWCDDIRSNFYNKYLNVKNLKLRNIKHEKLWREDSAYDIIIVISHNHKPTIKNKGSAIFIHCSFSDNRNTAGCIAMKKKDLVFFMKNVNRNTYVKI